MNNDKLTLLKTTLPLKWRVQSAVPKAQPTHVQMIAYVDARDVAAHLDNIVGAENWSDKYEDIKGNLFCSIGILCASGWVWKSDCGTESKTEKEKGESSDAFKRAAVKWGVNRDAYRVGMVKLKCKQYGNQYYPCDEKGTFIKGEQLYSLCNSLAKIEELENYNLEEKQENKYEMLTELFDLKEKAIPANEHPRIKSIIDNKETTSYNKALNYLKEL